MSLDNNNIYINSFQACDILEHQYGKPMKSNFVGMMPFSLESIKLEEFGMKVFRDNRDKLRTNDIINVRYKYSSKSYDEILSRVDIDRLNESVLKTQFEIENTEIKSVKSKLIYKLQSTKSFINYLENVEFNKKSGMNKFQLRDYLYDNGFTFNGVDYVVYKRTSAKSRTGQVQFIKKSIKDKAIRWARLGMDLEGLSKEDGIDYPSLLAYEGLVSSSIIDTMIIDPSKILLISDVISEYEVKANVIEKGDNGLLRSTLRDDVLMTSDLFDGESLLDKSYIKNGKGCALLRNHMFKSCAFGIDMQKFFKDYCKMNNIEYDSFKIKDMFGDEYLAKNIVMITTPNSLKALKFSKRKGTQKKMYEHWKTKVIDDKCRFGICKYEKESKRGTDELGNIVNRTSYQILNSMPFTFEEIETMARFEIDYINKLKNDDSEYINYLMLNANETNSNNMLVSIYEVNKDILNVKEVKNKRKSDIFSYKRNVQMGRIRLSGDYCIICQNPKEMMYHAIGELPLLKQNILNYSKWEDKHELVGNSAHIPLHEFDREYSAFRSPHTAPSNVLVLNNVRSEFVEKYMSYTNNIVYTNSINIEINRILSGQDADSDAVVIFDDDTMLNVAKRCYSKYAVCENNITASPAIYKVCTSDMSKIDNTLSNSQRNIGEIVNLGQVCMSKYWDLINSDSEDIDLINTMIENVNICTILSEVAIDLAKKMYDIDMDAQIKHISNTSKANVKPMFFSQITKSKSPKLCKMKTAMDYLYDIMENIEDADSRKTMHMFDIISNYNFKNSKKHNVQKRNTLESISKYIQKRNSIFSKLNICQDEDEKAELYEELERELYDCFKEIGKYKLSKETMYLTLSEIVKTDAPKGSKKSVENIISKDVLNYMNLLYLTNKNVFLSMF